MANSILERLGKYEIIGEIGRGGFAAVYEAVDTILDRTVALKFLEPRLLREPTFVERFQREAQLAANLKHPNIVIIHEFGWKAGAAYMAMEFLEGRTLKEVILQGGALHPKRIVNMVRQIASALDYAHGRGLVHRDIKPSNIMVEADDHVTVMDFGIAKATTLTALTTTGRIFGTPEYMSPEQAEGLEEPDVRSDLYSLGVVVYEMFTGKVPFSGTVPLSVMRGHADKLPPSPSDVNPDISPAVEAVLLRALAKKREERYQRAGDMALALEKALRKEAEDRERAEARAREERAKAEAERKKLERLSILAEAEKAYEAGRWQDAIDAFERVLALDVEYRDAATRLALARRELTEKARLEEARRAETRAEAERQRRERRAAKEVMATCISCHRVYYEERPEECPRCGADNRNWHQHKNLSPLARFTNFFGNVWGLLALNSLVLPLVPALLWDTFNTVVAMGAVVPLAILLCFIIFLFTHALKLSLREYEWLRRVRKGRNPPLSVISVVAFTLALFLGLTVVIVLDSTRTHGLVRTLLTIAFALAFVNVTLSAMLMAIRDYARKLDTLVPQPIFMHEDRLLGVIVRAAEKELGDDTSLEVQMWRRTASGGVRALLTFKGGLEERQVRTSGGVETIIVERKQQWEAIASPWGHLFSLEEKGSKGLTLVKQAR